MARKKKLNNVAITEEISATAQKQTLSYQGNICIKTLRGNKVISTKNLKNAGLPNLFKFLSYALAGKFYPDMQPCKIKLYNFANTKGVTPAEFVANINSETIVKPFLKEASPYVVYDATPVVEKTSSNTYTTTFRFKVPSYWLFSDKYNLIYLCTDSDVQCAYYLFINDDGTWNTQTISAEHGTGNFSLIIEWTLEIANK